MEKNRALLEIFLQACRLRGEVYPSFSIPFPTHRTPETIGTYNVCRLSS